MARGTRQCLSSAGKMDRNARHDFTSQVVSAIVAIGIAFVFDPGQRMHFCIAQDQRPRNIEEWANQARATWLRPLGRHSSGAGNTRSAQQTEENRLGLIIAMVGQRQPFGSTGGKRRMTHAPRGGFQALTAGTRHLDAMDFQRHLQAPTKIDAESCPGSGIAAQSVIDVHRREIDLQPGTTQAVERVQQDNRVDAPG